MANCMKWKIIQNNSSCIVCINLSQTYIYIVSTNAQVRPNWMFLFKFVRPRCKCMQICCYFVTLQNNTFRLKNLWITGLLIFLSLFWIILKLRYSLSCFGYYASSNIHSTKRSKIKKNIHNTENQKDQQHGSHRTTGVNPGAGKMLKWTGGAQVPV
jgi:hypothetical protein